MWCEPPAAAAAAAAAAAVVCAALLAPSGGAATAPATQTPWTENFNGDTLDLTRWSFRSPPPRRGGDVMTPDAVSVGVMTPDAVSVGDGMLTITTFTEGGVHRSGMIGTQQLLSPLGVMGFEQTYGEFEARVKFNSTSGMWSSFWLQSPTIGNPVGDPQRAGVEMDIAEHRARCVRAPSPTPQSVCSNDNDITDRIQQALVWDGYEPGVSKSAVRLSDPLDGLRNDTWHNWKLRWTPTDLTWYFDGMPIWHQTCSTSDPGCPISQRSQYIVLSSEVWPEFAGAIPPGGYGSRLTSKTKMQVDWVTVRPLG